MKVTLYKGKAGKLSILVEAAIGHGKPPVLIPEVTRENLRGLLAPVLDHQKGRREPAATSEGQG